MTSNYSLVTLKKIVVFCVILAPPLLAAETPNSPSVPPISEPVSCAEDAKPALLIVEGDNKNPEQFKTYTDALLQAKVYPQLDGYYKAVGDPAVVFEGEWDERKFMVVARFPCRARAEQFWYSDTYQGIKELREGAGDVRALLFEELGIPQPANWEAQ